ncbi:disulfide bond formation protein DsbA [Hahella sp. CCB-MM4]|uniref:thiol:disulfide interchange protein DsbA/DsbL n=1 Tax=Hahella sp. (strain CCB-MM4) TaxID=1926491 RepID=UPI000B9B7FEB|nr:thiol:disulfide interchange protein DsbA/DsbL [Hahella sp. CCB-MM4]OZG74949.1 disulfide bond formation protein DsbA [Hahella sp. CCB-MM4]
MRKSLPFVMWVVLACIGLVSKGVMAEDFVDGKDYQSLPAQVPVRDSSKIEVVEMFWFGCPHCYRFDPMVTNWKKKLPEDVDFWQSPAAFNRTWKLHAQTFYAAEALGVADQMHQPLFDALARDHKPLNSEDAMAEFFAQHGIEEEKFKKAYNSFSVKSKVQQAVSRGTSYRITGVPVLIVNGKYRIEPGQAGSFERMLKIADYLVEKERSAQGS